MAAKVNVFVTAEIASDPASEEFVNAEVAELSPYTRVAKVMVDVTVSDLAVISNDVSVGSAGA